MQERELIVFCIMKIKIEIQFMCDYHMLICECYYFQFCVFFSLKKYWKKENFLEYTSKLIWMEPMELRTCMPEFIWYDFVHHSYLVYENVKVSKIHMMKQQKISHFMQIRDMQIRDMQMFHIRYRSISLWQKI